MSKGSEKAEMWGSWINLEPSRADLMAEMTRRDSQMALKSAWQKHWETLTASTLALQWKWGSD